MGKVAYFIPAVVFTLFYGFAASSGMGGIHPIAWLWILLLWGAGILLSKAVFWGGFLGAVPAAHFIYMGTRETGQIVNETPIGVVLLLYYAVCIACACTRGRRKRSTK